LPLPPSSQKILRRGAGLEETIPFSGFPEVNSGQAPKRVRDRSGFKFKVQGLKFKVVQGFHKNQAFGDLASMYYCTPPAFRQALSVEKKSQTQCYKSPWGRNIGVGFQGFKFQISGFRFQVSIFKPTRSSKTIQVFFTGWCGFRLWPARF
jgi:hypothetical protein